MLDQVLAGGAFHRNGTGRGDMVGGDGIAQERQHTGILDVLQLRDLGCKVVEERRLLNIG